MIAATQTDPIINSNMRLKSLEIRLEVWRELEAIL